MIFLIKIYQTFISGPLQAMFGSGCKFTPTCSEYAIQSIQKYGRIKGAFLATKRFLKCNPFSK